MNCAEQVQKPITRNFGYETIGTTHIFEGQRWKSDILTVQETKLAYNLKGKF